MKFNFIRKKSTSVTVFLISILISVPVYTAFSQTASDSEVLTFSMVLEEKDRVSDYAMVVEEYEKSLLEQQLYRLSGDPELGAVPSVRSQWNNLTEPLQTDINIDVDFIFYTGRNSVLEDKYQAALRNAEANRLKMENALNETVLNLYNLYSSVWLLQKDAIILEKEKQLAQNIYSGAYERYTEGVLSLNELDDAEEKLQTAETALQQNFLALRLAWFSFQQYRGKSDKLTNPEIPVLEEFRFEVHDVQKPVMLSEKVIASDGNILKLKNTLTSLNETAERLRNMDLSLSFKPYLSYEDYSANISYIPENRQIEISSSIPIASFNSSESQDNQKKWNAGLSMVFSVDTGAQNRIEKEIIKKEIKQQDMLLKSQIDRTTFELRAAYQQFVQAQQSLKLSETAYERQVRLQDAVRVRLEAGQALRSDLLYADIAVQRSLWKTAVARVGLQKAYMTLIVLTGDLSF